MILVFAHGISDDRPAGWAETWAQTIMPHLRDDVTDIVDLSWEGTHERYYRPTRSSRVNLLRDLGAINNPHVQRYTHDALAALEGVGEPVWIIAHSLGSVLVYQSLAYLQAGPKSGFHVERFITVGSPLWIPYSRVLRRLAFLSITMPVAGRPVNIGRWINIQGRLDVVAGFGVVPLPMAHLNLKSWSHHSFASYARSEAFAAALA